MTNLKERFIPARLIEARAARSITTQIALADLLGVHTSAISRWEDGTGAPSPEKLIELAATLRIRPSYFLRPQYDHGPNPVFFRSLASARKRDIARQRARLSWLQEISQICQHYVSFPTISLPVFFSGSFRQLRAEDLEGIATNLRDLFGLGNAPISNLISTLEAAGFIAGNDEMGTTKLDGLCQWSNLDGRPYILLASDKMSFFRRQMDVAHEMSHAVLHRGVTESDLKSDFELIEEQAFRLASAFLMPAGPFSASVGTQPTLATLLTLKDRWRVSVKAMIRRCQDLDILDKEDARQLYKHYSAKGWNSGEPFDRSVPLNSPRLLGQALEMIVSAGRPKEQLLSNEFIIPGDDIEELVGLREGWFEQPTAQVVRLKTLETPHEYAREGDGSSGAKIVAFRRK